MSQKSVTLVQPDGTAHRAFCRAVRLLRQRHNLSCAEVGRRVNYTEATIAKIEEGIRNPTDGLVADFDKIYETPGLLVGLWDEVLVERRRAAAALDVEDLTLTQLMAAIGLGSAITTDGVRVLRERCERVLSDPTGATVAGATATIAGTANDDHV